MGQCLLGQRDFDGNGAVFLFGPFGLCDLNTGWRSAEQAPFWLTTWV